MIVADSDVLIDFLAGVEPAAGRVAIELESRLFVTTAVTRFEMLAGTRDTTAESVVRRPLDTLPTLPLDREAADRAAELRRGIEKTGQGIGMGDSLIAGIVLAHDAILLTRNRRHFERVEGLSLATL